MEFVCVFFKSGSIGRYNCDELRLTFGFLKIISHEYGNVVLRREEIIRFEVI